MNRNLLVLAAMTLWVPSMLGATQGSLYLGAAGTGGEIDLTAGGGGKDKIAEGGGTVGGQLLYDFSKSFAAGIDINHTKFGEKTSMALLPFFTSTLNLKSTVVLALGKWTALADQRVRPYLTGGIGFHNSSFKFEAAPIYPFVWASSSGNEKRALVDDSKSAMAAAVGLGIDLDVSKSVFFSGEARYTYLGKVTWDSTNLGQAGGLDSVKGDNSMVQLLIKLGFKFGGGSSDSDASQSPTQPQSQTQTQPQTPPQPSAPAITPGAI